MKTIISALTLLALSSQANANDAVKQGILGVMQCVGRVIDAAPGKPRVHGDAIVVAIRVCEGAKLNLVTAFEEAGYTDEEQTIVVDQLVKVMFDAWVVQ